MHQSATSLFISARRNQARLHSNPAVRATQYRSSASSAGRGRQESSTLEGSNKCVTLEKASCVFETRRGKTACAALDAEDSLCSTESRKHWNVQPLTAENKRRSTGSDRQCSACSTLSDRQRVQHRARQTVREAQAEARSVRITARGKQRVLHCKRLGL